MSFKPGDYSFETLAIHAGQDPEATTGAVVVPIFQTSTYAQESLGNPRQGYDYSRADNPTRKAYEDCIAALENGRFGTAYSSGMGAINNCMYLLKSRDEVIVGDDVYGGTYRFFTKVMDGFGITARFVDTSDIKAVQEAITPKTRMIWVETPTNPLLKISDLRALAELAKAHRAYMVVDNTFMSPYFQKPLDLGAHIVVHSATKYLGGHSDVIGGALVTNDPEIHERMKFCQKSVGAVPGPFDCWLTLRGIKTLAIRMREHQANALRLAQWLSEHSEVERVIYPGLPSHPHHELAKRQMSGFGGMVSFVVRGGLEKAKKVLEGTKIFLLAESLGGVESLIEHPAIMTHASIPPERRREIGISDGLIRLSVGIEAYDDLQKDLECALNSGVPCGCH
ncbi:MAG: cystathionine gamma-synthase [Candidatus Eremiobacteraeota bacterium]|nr:cystathionine gamma-synthase [Candidatus Eremiobacteraeota bacterium]